MNKSIQKLTSLRKRLSFSKTANKSHHLNHFHKSNSLEKSLKDVELLENECFDNQTYFHLSFYDATISMVNEYRPSYLRLVVCRRKTKFRSELISWEPSFKCTSTGSVVWPHPFECTIAITPPSIKDSTTGTLRHKDITISLQNVDKRSKNNSTKPAKKNKKTLAKIRLNLADYYATASLLDDVKHDNTTSSTYKPSSLKIKLRPESSKVANASINLTIQRTNFNPSALLQIPPETNVENLEKKREAISHSASPNISNKPIDPDRFSFSDDGSEDAISVESQSDSSIDESPVKLVVPPEDENINHEASCIEASISSKGLDANKSNVIFEKNEHDSEVKSNSTPKIIPPPLPLRDWQKSNPKINDVNDEKSRIHESKYSEEIIEPVKNNLQPEIKIQTEINNTSAPISSDENRVADIIGSETKGAREENKTSIDRNSTSTFKDELPIIRVPADLSIVEPVAESECLKLQIPEKNPSSYDSVKSEHEKGLDKQMPNDQTILTTPQKSLPRIKVPPSPIMRPNKPNEKEKQLIEWANKTLSNQEPPIKITNLFTSWQNGLGFCALIRKYYPTLIPPINQLKTDQRSLNCQLAVQASGLLGVETSSINFKESKDGMILDKIAVKLFLQELKSIFDNNDTVALTKNQVTEHQCQWYDKAGFFADIAEEIIHRKELENERVKEETRLKEQVEKDRLVQEQQKKEREEVRQKLYKNSEQVGVSPSKSRKHEVKDLIEQAHNSASSENDTSQNSAHSDLPDADNSNNLKKLLPDEEQLSPNSESTSSTSNAGEHISHDEENQFSTETAQTPVGMPESKTIAEELFLLTKEESRIAREKDELEEVLREEEYDPNMHEIIMQKWMQLVNQKNSVVRRQMQLNIKEKEKIVSYDLDRIQQKLQTFNGLDDSRKTDAMKEEEQKLIESHVALVNKKNELVLQLDTQEQAIADDERIQALVARRDFVTLQREEGCRLQ